MVCRMAFPRARRGGLRRWRRGLWCRRFSDRQILAHYFKRLSPEPAHREQIVNAPEPAVRLPQLQDFFSPLLARFPALVAVLPLSPNLRFTGCAGDFFLANAQVPKS